MTIKAGMLLKHKQENAYASILNSNGYAIQYRKILCQYNPVRFELYRDSIDWIESMYDIVAEGEEAERLLKVIKI